MGECFGAVGKFCRAFSVGVMDHRLPSESFGRDEDLRCHLVCAMHLGVRGCWP